MEWPNPKNSRRDDILLACKGHYSKDNELSRANLLQKVVGYHAGIRSAYVKNYDIIEMMLADNYDLIFTKSHRPVSILMEILNESDSWFGNPQKSHSEKLIEAIAGQISVLQVQKDDGTILIEMSREIDPKLVEFINEKYS